MGSYSPVPGIDSDRAREIAELVHQPIVDELRRRGTPFHGVLYAGLMMSADGDPRDRAYAAAERIEFDGRQMRTDIAARAVGMTAGGSRPRTPEAPGRPDRVRL